MCSLWESEGFKDTKPEMKQINTPAQFFESSGKQLLLQKETNQGGYPSAFKCSDFSLTFLFLAF